MKTIKFAIRPYRDHEGVIDPKFVYLCIVADDSEVITRDCVSTNDWRDNYDNFQEYWKHELLSRVKDRLIKASKASDYRFRYKEETRLVLDDATYDDWYHWYYFIDGEDASEFIRHCKVSQHTLRWQARCGVIVGWKFYKKLRAHNFCEETAAMLAYTRGFLTGMETNNPLSSEGTEALSCLGLTIEDGEDALREF